MSQKYLKISSFQYLRNKDRTTLSRLFFSKFDSACENRKCDGDDLNQQFDYRNEEREKQKKKE